MEESITGDWDLQSEDEALVDSDYDGLHLETAPASSHQPEPAHRDPPRLGPAPTSATLAENAYFMEIQEGSGLQLTMEVSVRSAFEKDGVYGLFSLFVTSTLRQSIRGWTTAQLEVEGKKAVSESELNAYIGLEMAMSLCPLNDIADYWSKDRFLGQTAFIETMCRDRFQHIRAALQLHPPSLVTFNTVRDPLYRCRGLLQHFQKRFAETAVPLGVSSLDEISVRTKARSRARTYMPSKPDKYGLRFYSVVGWDSLYVHSIWDNGSGNVTQSTPAERYTQLFPSLRTPLWKTLSLPDIIIDRKSATALWIAMAGHQTSTFRSPSGHRLLVSDNFYTRHTYARAIDAFTDGEVKLLGTVRLNLVDKFNKFALEPAVGRVASQDRGSWELVAAVDPESNYKTNDAAHKKKQKALPKKQRTEYMPTLTYARNAGYIVFKDRKVVIFYSNDLKRTMSASTLTSDSPEAIDCCHGTVPLLRWTGDTILDRKALVAPTLIAVYNKCMNAVDRVDQLRSTNPTRRREKRMHMSVFTWLLDLSVINAYALQRHTTGSAPAPVSLREFKRTLVDTLTCNEKSVKQQRDRRQKKRNAEQLDEAVGSDISLHAITPNSTKHSNGKLTCYLCSLRGMPTKKAKYGCTKCKRGFHVECYTAFHFEGALQTEAPQLQDALEAIARAPTGDPVAFTRKRSNRSITPVSELILPHKH